MPPTPKDAPNVALEIDIATSLALSRATTRAVSQLSKEAHEALMRALEKEVRLQETQGGPVSEMVASLISAYAQDLK